ncbi:MAG: purine-nucleoside phosphorylase [Saprospiraceae bacterium]|nr:purine-nucleoside phosphorylase [Saprospiraceae bacterium]
MLYDNIQESLEFIRSRTPFQPKFGIILGTGLGGLVDEIEIIASIDYGDIPHFPVSTVQSHAGKLIFGLLDRIPVVAMAGRFHYYEGYSMEEVTFPVRVLKFLGIKRLVISNVSGGTNPDFKAGDIVFVRDHIYLQSENPLRGANDERLGPRFPDMLNIYDRKLNGRALKIASAHNIRAHEGVYLCLQGPNLETPSEYVYIHRVGADMVGMSTIPEVIVAHHMSLPVFVISVISNQSYPPEVIKEVSVEEVIAMAKSVEPKMSLIVKEILKEEARSY